MGNTENWYATCVSVSVSSCTQTNGKLGSIIYTWEQPSRVLLMDELKHVTIYISANPSTKLCSCTIFWCQCVISLVLYLLYAHTPYSNMQTTLCISISCSNFKSLYHMYAYDYWFYKEGPFNSIEAFRLAFIFSVWWCSLKAMKPLTCPGMRRREGAQFDKAAVIHFNFLIKPKYLLWIGPLKYTN